MQTLHFFDCNASFGRRKSVLPHSFHTKEDLLKYMDSYGIKRALVSHSIARELDPVSGNQILLDEISNTPDLIPAWVALPGYTNEFPAPEEFIFQMKKANVKAVTVLPASHSYYFSPLNYSCHDLYSVLEARAIPLILSFTEIDENLETLHSILVEHPKLKIIFTNVTYVVSRNLYPLMKKFPNLYVETSGVKGMDAIEDMCDVFGANRLLFGSNMPVGSGAAAIGLITYADISFADKERIACENLNELLGGVLL